MKLTPIQLTTLDNHLGEYNSDLTFEEILETMGEENGAAIWEPFEYWDTDFLAEHMRGIVASYEQYSKIHSED